MCAGLVSIIVYHVRIIGKEIADIGAHSKVQTGVDFVCPGQFLLIAICSTFRDATKC